MRRRLSTCAGALLLASWLPANALRAADVPPPTAAAVRTANPPAVTAQVWRQGRVTAVDITGGRVEIDGVWWRFFEGQTRFEQKGRAVSAALLANGQVLGFGVSADNAVLGIVHVP